MFVSSCVCLSVCTAYCLPLMRTRPAYVSALLSENQYTCFMFKMAGTGVDRGHVTAAGVMAARWVCTVQH